MKYLIASDVHGSYYYAKKIIDLFNQEKADKILLLGDILYHGPRNDLPREYSPKQVFELFNEYKKKRYEKLKQNLRAFSEDEIFQKINWKCYVENRKFKEIWQRFNKIRLSNVPCLCIFDQFGVKEISEEIFKELIDSKK